LPSPDQSTYTSLVLYDRSGYELVQRAVTDASTKLPGFVPSMGKLEMVLLESLALITDELIFTANRLPDGVMEVLMSNFGIVRDLGVPPQTTITITVIDTTGYEIPSGVQFRLDDGSGNSITFTTTAAGVVAPGSTTVVVPATGSANTDIYNGTPIGTDLVPLSPVAIIDSAKLATIVSGGAGPETDNEWRDRAVQLFASLSSVLVLPSHFTARALVDPGVARAFTKDNWNVTASAAGHVTVAVADSTGLALSGGAKTALQNEMDALALAALTVHVVDPDYNTVDVTMTVVTKPGESTATVQAAVNAALTAYLSPTKWGWGATVRIYELVSVADQVNGVDYVSTVTSRLSGGTLAATDVTLVGPFPLVLAGTINVTATAP
jgi:uncharacterized phage protein gp47/JayE